MPPTKVVIFCEADGSAPLLDWLDGLPAKAREKCIVRIERLKALGYELRRPEADTLRNGIHELRARIGTVNYRMLYFFHGQTAVVSHGLTKESGVPSREIDLAVARQAMFQADLERHTLKE
jgi:phage-related protein